MRHGFGFIILALFGLSVAAQPAPPLEVTFDEQFRFDAHDAMIHAIDYHPDGDRLASGDADGIIIVWDMENGEEIQRLLGHDRAVLGIAYHPDGDLLASSGDDSFVILWDTETGDEQQRFTGPKSPLSDLHFNPDGTSVAAIAMDGTMHVWDIESGAERVFNVSKGGRIALAYNTDGTYIYTASDDGVIREWNLSDGIGFPIIERKDALTRIATSNDYLAYTDEFGHIGVYNLDEAQTVENVRIGSDIVTTLAFHPEESHVLAAGGCGNPNRLLCLGGLLKLWDIETGRLMLTAPMHDDQLTDVAFHPDGTQLATASSDGRIIVWEIDGLPVDDD